jgi:two-component system, OmpR family, response regulator
MNKKCRKFFPSRNISQGQAICSINKTSANIFNHKKLTLMQNVTTMQKKAIKKALVIEDDGEMGLLLNLLLDEDELELDYVKDIVSAREYLQHESPAIIILDNKLPDGFGVDFISYIKKKYPQVKIIMISGFSSARDVALENGADVFLEKPFSKKEFYHSVQSLLK